MKEKEVLIVDDDRLMLEVMAEVLENNFKVLKALNAEEAWELFCSKRPACIISDIVMPGKSGISFLRQLRDEGHDVPVIVITGQGNREYAEECANLRTSGYINKPVDAGLLTEMVKRVTGNCSTENSPSTRHPILSKVRIWIGKNLSSSLLLGDAAKVVDKSVSHLSRVYKNELGISFTDDVNRMRVERAKWLLRSTDNQVSAICEAIGYDSPQHFFRNFKKTTGMTPREYRQSGR